MKTIITSLMIVAMLGLGLSSVVQAAGHSDRGCDLCHVPHNAAAGDVPLWNPAVPDGSVNFATDFYTSNTLDATTGAPDGASKLCLGCHDGTYGGAHNPGTGKSFGVGAGMGTLSATHPISFVYDTALATADGELLDPSGTPTVAALLDPNSKVQCTSCHEVHQSNNNSYLRMAYSGTSETFCRTCHVK